MDDYKKIMVEIDVIIKSIEDLKNVIADDVIRNANEKYAKRNGSMALINRTKLNIRDAFRRIEGTFGWKGIGTSCCDYSDLIKNTAKRINASTNNT